MKRRRRGTRIRQKLRRVELWPVLKLAVAFHAICAAISLGVLVLLWRLGEQAGFTEKVTSFLTKVGFAESVTLDGDTIFRGTASVVGAIAIHNIAVTFLLAVLYNLLAGLFGGLILSVVEEQPEPKTDQKTQPRSGKKQRPQRPKTSGAAPGDLGASDTDAVSGSPETGDLELNVDDEDHWMDDLDRTGDVNDVAGGLKAPQRASSTGASQRKT